MARYINFPFIICYLLLFVTVPYPESREWVNIGGIHQSVCDATKLPLKDVRRDRTPSFKKYVPVPIESLISNKAPMIIHDQVDRSEWIRVQLAVDAERRRFLPAFPGPPVHRARSDTSLVSVGPSDDDDYDIDWTAVSPELEALCRNRKSTRHRTVQRTYALNSHKFHTKLSGHTPISVLSKGHLFASNSSRHHSLMGVQMFVSLSDTA